MDNWSGHDLLRNILSFYAVINEDMTEIVQDSGGGWEGGDWVGCFILCFMLIVIY